MRVALWSPKIDRFAGALLPVDGCREMFFMHLARQYPL